MGVAGRSADEAWQEGLSFMTFPSIVAILRVCLAAAALMIMVLSGLILTLWIATLPRPIEPALPGRLMERTIHFEGRNRRYLVNEPSHIVDAAAIILV